jgi:alkyl sulfatase BDS1-like metallo-beta-lactamase superfamily hydrolase
MHALLCASYFLPANNRPVADCGCEFLGGCPMSRVIQHCMVFALLAAVSMSGPARAQERHFHPKGKPPSKFTSDLQQSRRTTLPLADQRDFEEAKKGFIAAPSYKQIKAEAGHVAWDMASYEFLLQGKDFASIHPSLQRQAILNMAYGLYEVLPGKIYQVRGYDLANFTLVKGDKGWIVFDPLTAKETARAALDFANEKLGKRPVLAVVYSHSHGDHFGGVRGVVEEADVKSGTVQVIAPKGFMDHAVSENVMAGTAMTRRMFYQYGVLLPRSPFGHVDQSIGKNTAAGNTGLIEPNVIIEKPFEELTVDGVRMVFQNTPGTEAPAEMNTWFPQMKAFWAAENITGTIHNIYTLRGALVRDALEWSKQINEAIYRFGMECEVMFASHSWPRWGNARVLEVMRTQRDAYAHLNNQVLHLANQGVTINEIHNVYRQPKSLQQQWAAHSYHGSEAHNSRAVINRYLGYWDANPATLIPLSPKESAPLYVEMMGGADNIIKRGRELHDAGQYLHAQEILNKLLHAQPQNQAAKDLLADVWEQLGYQQESPSVRNSFLAGAYELRSGIPAGAAPKGSGPDMIRAMTTGLWLDFLGVRLQGEKVEGQSFVMNFLTPDNGGKFVVELSNGTLTNIPGHQAKNPTLTIAVNRTDLESVMMGQKSLDDLITAGTAKLQGDRRAYDLHKGSLVQFDMGFEILPGTKAKPEMPKMNAFQQTTPAPTDGG